MSARKLIVEWFIRIFVFLFDIFHHLEPAHPVSNLYVVRYCACSLCAPFSFKYFHKISPHVSFGLPILQCHSIVHVLITTTSSVVLSTRPNHPILASIIFSLVLATPGAKTIKKKKNSTENKSQTQRDRSYKVTSFLSTDCELSTETCSKNVYSPGPCSCSSLSFYHRLSNLTHHPSQHSHLCAV